MSRPRTLLDLAHDASSPSSKHAEALLSDRGAKLAIYALQLAEFGEQMHDATMPRPDDYSQRATILAKLRQGAGALAPLGADVGVGASANASASGGGGGGGGGGSHDDDAMNVGI